MDLKQINKLLHNVERELGNAFISIDFWNIADAASLADYYSQAVAYTLFNQLTGYTKEAFDTDKYLKLDKYYILDLHDKMVLVIPFDEFLWEMLIGTKS